MRILLEIDRVALTIAGWAFFAWAAPTTVAVLWIAIVDGHPSRRP